MSNARASEALKLYREFVRCARTFTDYNVREYVRRRARAGFAKARTNANDALDAFARGRDALEVARRQSTIYALYAKFSRASVMEAKEEGGR